MPKRWTAASGYKTKSGKSKWRCVRWNDPAEHRLGFTELQNRAFVPRLYNSQEAAQRECDVLNKDEES